MSYRLPSIHSPDCVLLLPLGTQLGVLFLPFCTVLMSSPHKFSYAIHIFLTAPKLFPMFSASYLCICFWWYFMLLCSTWLCPLHFCSVSGCAFAAALDTPVIYQQWRQLFFQQSHCTFFPLTSLPLITSGLKISYWHESAIFCAVWQHTNLLFLQLPLITQQWGRYFLHVSLFRGLEMLLRHF